MDDEITFTMPRDVAHAARAAVHSSLIELHKEYMAHPTKVRAYTAVLGLTPEQVLTRLEEAARILESRFPVPVAQ